MNITEDLINAVTVNRHFLYDNIWKLIPNMKDNPDMSNRLQDALEEVLPKELFRKITSPSERGKTEKEISNLKKTGVEIVTIFDRNYPALLRECPDAPLVLYVKSSSSVEEIFKSRMISVAGTRDMSPYGSRCIDIITENICNYAPEGTLVSGMAIGTDTRLHRRALEKEIKTIAVLPTGIDNVYPAANKELAEIIVETPGCALVTSYPTETAPMAINFLRRNRIVAGLSEMTFITETKAKGGAIVTARLAYEYGRHVYAFPGRIDDIRSQGCNQLIHEGTAQLFSL